MAMTSAPPDVKFGEHRTDPDRPWTGRSTAETPGARYNIAVRRRSRPPPVAAGPRRGRHRPVADTHPDVRFGCAIGAPRTGGRVVRWPAWSRPVGVPGRPRPHNGR